MPWICPLCSTTNESTDLLCFVCNTERPKESIEAEKRELRLKKIIKNVEKIVSIFKISFIIYSFLCLAAIVFYVVISLITNNFLSTFIENFKILFQNDCLFNLYNNLIFVLKNINLVIVEKFNSIFINFGNVFKDLFANIENVFTNNLIIFENINKIFTSIGENFMNLFSNAKIIFTINHGIIENLKLVCLNIYNAFKDLFNNFSIVIFNNHWNDLIINITEVLKSLEYHFKSFFMAIKILATNIGEKCKELFSNIASLFENIKEVTART